MIYVYALGTYNSSVGCYMNSEYGVTRRTDLIRLISSWQKILCSDVVYVQYTCYVIRYSVGKISNDG
jgi:hypothetical protein